MEDYFKELRLSRGFACQFDEYLNWCRANNVHLPEELVNSYVQLNNHYQFQMEKNLS
jgi:hypothetical protein